MYLNLLEKDVKYKFRKNKSLIFGKILMVKSIIIHPATLLKADSTDIFLNGLKNVFLDFINFERSCKNNLKIYVPFVILFHGKATF